MTTGTKACRLKVCEDFELITNDACSIVLTQIGQGTKCISDGKKCIAKAPCT